jgi:hypothetical protein
MAAPTPSWLRLPPCDESSSSYFAPCASDVQCWLRELVFKTPNSVGVLDITPTELAIASTCGVSEGTAV